MLNMRLAVIGAGQMGQALIKAFAGMVINAEDIAVYDVDDARAGAVSAELGCRKIGSSDIGSIAEYDAVLLAVKPQVISAVIGDIGVYLDNALVMSIAAGKSIAELRACGLQNSPLVRIMPNTPALVGSGVSGISFSDDVSNDQRQWVIKLFSSCGLAFEIREDLLDAVTGLSGSGPAYMMLVMEALADGGVRQGLSRELSMKMAAMTMLGSAKLVLETDQHPAVLKDQVCSPGGTTIEAVAILEERGLRSSLIEAVAASSEKARKLSGR